METAPPEDTEATAGPAPAQPPAGAYPDHADEPAPPAQDVRGDTPAPTEREEPPAVPVEYAPADDEAPPDGDVPEEPAAETTAPQPAVEPFDDAPETAASHRPEEPPRQEEPSWAARDDQTLTFPAVPAAGDAGDAGDAAGEVPDETPAAGPYRAPEPGPAASPDAPTGTPPVGSYAASDAPAPGPYGADPEGGWTSDQTYADRPAQGGAPPPGEAPSPPPAAAASYGPPQQYGTYGQPAPPYGGAYGGYPDVREPQPSPGGGYPGGGDIVASDYDYEEYEPTPKRSSSKTLLLLACAVVAVIALTGTGVAGYQVIVQPQGATSDTSPSPGQPTAGQNGSPTPTQNPAKLNSASTDPEPMTLQEAFPNDSVEVGGRSYEKVEQELTQSCARAGRNEFSSVLEEAGCDRVLRATYVDGASTYAVTIGIAVLPSRADAAEVRESTDPQSRVFPKALNGSPGAQRIEDSPGFGAYTYVGRYFVYALAAFSDGHEAGEQEAEKLKQQSVAFRKYATKPLFQRMYETN